MELLRPLRALNWLCRDPNFERETQTFDKPVEIAALESLVAQASEKLYRAKGSILTTEGWRYLDWSAGRLTLEPCPPAPASTLVMIRGAMS
jgi:hypothetical protein